MHPLIQVAGGILAADFAAAFFHFWEDVYLPYTHKSGIFPIIARDNELHHALPYAMTSYSPFANIRITLALSIIIACIIYALAPDVAKSNWIFILSMVIAGTLSNLFHRWQHERECTRPRIITQMQKAGLIVSRDQHHEHHQDPSRRYGVMLGFTNYMYDGLHIWDMFRAIIPLKQYQKPGVDAYSDMIPGDIQTELARDCPRRLTMREVGHVKQTLWREFSNSNRQYM